MFPCQNLVYMHPHPFIRQKNVTPLLQSYPNQTVTATIHRDPPQHLLKNSSYQIDQTRRKTKENRRISRHINHVGDISEGCGQSAGGAQAP